MARITVPVRLRWSDIDGYGHVNNAAMFTLLEEARIAVFWGSASGAVVQHPEGRRSNIIDAGPEASTHTLIARQEIEYLAALPYSAEPVEIELWISRIGGASIDVCYEVPGPAGLAARAATTIVLVDAGSGRPRRISEHERRTWQWLMDEPITFRRRPR